MQAVTNKRVTGLQKRIVKALETGKDPAPLLKELGELRAKIAAEAELAELQKIADERQKKWDFAAKVQEKVKLQGEAIDAFLKLRDSITEALSPILERAQELPKLQEACYEQYHDPFVFAAVVKTIPKGYLSMDGFNCPMLEMTSGVTDSYDVAAQGLFYLQAGCGLLANLTKGKLTLTHPEKPAGDFDGDLEADIYPDLSCGVCKHPEREAIDKALQNGRSLRDIETEFGISKSSLSRHKQHIAVPVSQEE